MTVYPNNSRYTKNCDDTSNMTRKPQWPLVTTERTDSYRPEQILVSDEQADNVSHPCGHVELLLLGDLAAEALEHEDVGSHHHGDVVQSHLVLLLVIHHPSEKLKKCLKNRNRTMRLQNLVTNCKHNELNKQKTAIPLANNVIICILNKK